MNKKEKKNRLNGRVRRDEEKKKWTNWSEVNYKRQTNENRRKQRREEKREEKQVFKVNNEQQTSEIDGIGR